MAGKASGEGDGTKGIRRPSTGPLGGGTRVLVSGSELTHGADLYCRFPVEGGAPPGPFWGGGGGGGGIHVTAAWAADQAAVVAASRVTDAAGQPALVSVAPITYQRRPHKLSASRP